MNRVGILIDGSRTGGIKQLKRAQPGSVSRRFNSTRVAFVKNSTRMSLAKTPSGRFRTEMVMGTLPSVKVDSGSKYSM
eukprot:3728931-Rhodomonas_salina.3